MRSALGWLLASCLFACGTGDIDPQDLKDVFERPAGSASAPSLAASAPADEKDEQEPRPPSLIRSRPKGPCVEPGGRALEGDARPARRPACRRARILELRDRTGAPRYACVFSPDDLARRAPLPLVVFFHDEYDDATAVQKKTRLRRLLDEIDLTGEPRRRGFVLVAPQARKIEHALRFDTGHRAGDNLDAQVVDRFVEELDGEGLVDRERIYALGAGRGGEMAALWAMLRPDRVTAMGVFAAAPDVRWSCGAEPPPAAVAYRSCDAITSCADVEQWLSARERARAPTHALRLGAGNSLEPSCATSRHRCGKKRGTADHVRWPKEREQEILEYLGRFRFGAGD